MEHILRLESVINCSIKVTESKEFIFIEVSNNNSFESVALNKSELHSFIGTLLHVQQKMK